MAKITITGDAVVITSSQTLEDIRVLEKYRPKALCLFDVDENGQKEEAFKVCSTNGSGTINQYGASFGSATHDDQKRATITLTLPRGIDDATEYVAETIGAAILSLNRVEQQFAAALAGVADEKAAVMESISVTQ